MSGSHAPGPVFLGLVLCSSFVLACASSPRREMQDPALHGATAFAKQTELLARLKPTPAGTVPAGVDPAFWRVFAPEADTPAQAQLGQKLFFDPRLSKDGTVSCATCHDVGRNFVDLRPVSEGIGGKLGRRNAPTVLNAALIAPLFWDGRSPSLSHQAGQPVLNPIEMGMADQGEVVAKLGQTSDYPAEFAAAFGRPLDYDAVEHAIAAFERTLIFLDAPRDRFEAGEKSAISESAARGKVLFDGKARCAACHPLNPTNPLGTDYRFHNIGVSAKNQNFEKLAAEALQALAGDDSEKTLDRLALATDLSELGRFMVTKSYADIGSFRTPQLRNIGITPPYMHDGTQQTLWDVIDHYNKGGETNAYLDGGIEALALTEPEIDDLVAFLFTLTDHRLSTQNEEQMRKQKELASKQRPFRDDARSQRAVLDFEERVTGKAGKGGN